MLCENCKHDFNVHAEAWDDFDARFCSECNCPYFEGDIEEAWEDQELEKLWSKGIV